MKTVKIKENDKPWIDCKLLEIDRARKREYTKRKKSDKWKKLNKLFEERAEVLKENYYKNIVEDLKVSNVGQWYSKLKRMSSIDEHLEEKVLVEDLIDVPSDAQVELIADKFEEISKNYEPLLKENVSIPNKEDSKPLPLFEPYEIWKKITKMKKKSTTVKGDIPWKIIHEFAVELSEPLANIYNSASLAGVWPSFWKHEYVTPVPKVYLPRNFDDLRKISCTKNWLGSLKPCCLIQSLVT